MADTVWQVLGMVTAGGLLWLGILFLLAVLMEMGLPATSPIFESLLIFTGFQVAHNSGQLVATLPFLAVVASGRLCGSSASYWLLSLLGNAATSKGKRFGQYMRNAMERLQTMRRKLGGFVLPTIVVARFIPGFSYASTIASGISRIGYKTFFPAVLIHVLLWEAIFLGMGTLGGGVAKFLGAEFHPWLLLVWILLGLVAAGVAGYFLSRRVKSGS